MRFRSDASPEPVVGPVRRRMRSPGAPACGQQAAESPWTAVLNDRDALRAAAREVVRAFPERRAIAEKFDGAVRRVGDAALWLDGVCVGKVPPTLTAIFGEPPTLLAPAPPPHEHARRRGFQTFHSVFAFKCKCASFLLNESVRRHPPPHVLPATRRQPPASCTCTCRVLRPSRTPRPYLPPACTGDFIEEID